MRNIFASFAFKWLEETLLPLAIAAAGLPPATRLDELLRLKRIGFRQEGLMLKSVFRNGIWEDDLVFALLGEEWSTKRSSLSDPLMPITII